MCIRCLQLSVISLLGISGLLMLAGCSGGGSNANGNGSSGFGSYTLKVPVPVAGQNGSVGGSIFSLATLAGGTTPYLDEVVNATVTLTNSTTNTVVATTQSVIRGGYNFPSVPPGTYTLSATATSSSSATQVNILGSVPGVVVQGGLPTLMANLLLGESGQMCTFSGTITAQNGLPVPGATVSADITGNTPGSPGSYSSVILSFTTDAQGNYQIEVPGIGTDYYIAAHSATSQVSQTDDITAPTLNPTPNMENLTLADATTAIFAIPVLDIVSATLPAATTQAATQALTTQMAVARVLHAPQSRIDRLQKLYSGKLGTRGTRVSSNNGFVENDLYWSLTPESGQTTVDQGVCGFDIYRSPSATGPYTMVGTNHDPYLLFFFDNDPALSTGYPNNLSPSYYTVTSFAASNSGQLQQSPPAIAIEAQPLPQITAQITNAQGQPITGGTASLSTAQFTWAPVAGALSYVVLKYTNSPSFNDTPLSNIVVHTAGETSEPLNSLTPGTYWWTVAAFNNTDPNFATAATYTTYQKIVVTL